MTSDVILGLDISTSCTGISFLNGDGTLLYLSFCHLSGLEDSYEKGEVLVKRIKEIGIVPTRIVVEEHLLGFRPGMSSAGVLITLAKFNATVCHLLYREFGIKADEIPAVSARKYVQLKVPKGADAKACVMEWCKQCIPDYVWPTKVLKGGPRKGQVVLESGCADAADAYLLAKSFILKMKEEKTIIGS